MKTKLIYALLGLLLGVPGIAHADSIVYDFLAARPIGSSEIPGHEGTYSEYLIATFSLSLSQGQAPDWWGFDPGFGTTLRYDDVTVSFGEMINGIIDVGSGGPDTVYLYPDGVGFPFPGVGEDFYGGNQVWTGDPNHPTFVPGIYTNYDEIGDYVEVTQVPSPIPEPATFMMLGMGLLGVMGVVRRRLIG